MKNLLFLHNYEDIENMLNVASIMSYNDISASLQYPMTKLYSNEYSKQFYISDITIDEDGMLNILCTVDELIFPKKLI